MAIHKGPTQAVMLIAARLARVHVAFTVEADDFGSAVLTTMRQSTMDAAIEQQRNSEEDARIAQDRADDLLRRS